MVDAYWGLTRRIWHQFWHHFDSITPKCTKNRTFLKSQIPFWHHESSLSWFLLRGFGSNLIDIALFCQVTYRLTSTYTELTSFWQHMRHQSHIGTVPLYPLRWFTTVYGICTAIVRLCCTTVVTKARFVPFFHCKCSAVPYKCHNKPRVKVIPTTICITFFTFINTYPPECCLSIISAPHYRLFDRLYRDIL